MTAGVSTYTYTSYYDAMGRPTAFSQATGSQTYTMGVGYNKAGMVTSETYPSGRVISTAYDNAGRLSGVSGQKTGESNKTYATSFSYCHVRSQIVLITDVSALGVGRVGQP